MAKVSLRAYNREIEAMIDRNHLDEAIAHCKHILKTFPKHLDTYRLLGKAYLEYKRYPEAVDIFSRVLVAVPNDFVANVGMSIIRDEENKLDDAIWHMERAFETQPSNAAIQGELQRLYGRRDGVQLPRIRMTRGALAHMYVQGELYPQAISEIRSVLKDDPGRTDMQALLARAYYRSGAKNDAAEAASTLLRSEPYCLDANRILVEILGTDHPENVQTYRQRVVELDPYAAQVSGSIFLSEEVPDVAVSVERLDWNGQPVGLQPDWESRQAISLEGGRRAEEQPDWLKGTASETPPLVGQTPVSPFDAAPPSAKPAEPAENIPDFLRAAGWAQATGAFDESKSVFGQEEQPAGGEQALPGDLPDWVKAMAPDQPAATPTQEDELPDWINKIDKSALPPSSQPTEEPDWLSQLDQPASQPADEQPDWRNQQKEPAAQPAEDLPDWLRQLDATDRAPGSSGEEPDWLKGFETEAASSARSTGELAWLSQLGEEPKAGETPSSEFDFLKEAPKEAETSAASSSGELDWLSQLSETPRTAETPSNEFDFLNQPPAESETVESGLAEDDNKLLKGLGLAAATAAAASASDDFDFLNELKDESEQLAPASPTTPEPSVQDKLGMSSEEQDDSFAWLENLASKQGATEGLLTKPEERLEEEPDWVKRAKGLDTGQPPATQPAANIEELGRSEQEQDDSFAWLESLAAKQGATEGLLTTPEERREDEPDWVRQAKTLGEQPQETPSAQAPEEPIVETPVVEPGPAATSIEELGKSEAERDDAFAWLESLAAKRGATEGLLTKPEERHDEEPEWVKQAKDVSAEQLSAPEQPSSVEDTAAWLRSLDEDVTPPSAEPVSSKDETAVWFKNLEESQKEVPPQPVQETPSEELPSWMQNLEQDRASETLYNLSADDIAARASREETPEPSPGEELPAWMQDIEADRASETSFNIPAEEVAREPEGQAVEPEATADLPAWMQGIEDERASETDFNIPAVTTPAESGEKEPAVGTEWMSAIEQESVMETAADATKTPSEELPSWLSELDQEQEQAATPTGKDADLPAWLRDETGELVAEPTRIEPTRATDWQPVETKQPEPEVQPAAPEPEPAVFQAEAQPPQPEPEPVAVQAQPEIQAAQPEPAEVVNIIEEKIAAAQEPETPAEPPPPKPRKLKGTGKLSLPMDPLLGQARDELSGGNLSGALEDYDRLIKKGRFLDEVIYDLRESLYRFPVDVNIWQSLGDAYMRANRLQDALDAYTKAEELLR